MIWIQVSDVNYSFIFPKGPMFKLYPAVMAIFVFQSTQLSTYFLAGHISLWDHFTWLAKFCIS